MTTPVEQALARLREQMAETSEEYDRAVEEHCAQIAALGERYESVRLEAQALREQLLPLVIAAAKVNIPQREVADLARLSRQAINQWEVAAGVVRTAYATRSSRSELTS